MLLNEVYIFFLGKTNVNIETITNSVKQIDYLG